MRVSANFVLPLAALLLGFLILPTAALAGTTNCPVEPATDVPIATSQTFIGSNCDLNAVGDVDSFVFNGNAGDIWQLTLGVNGTITQDICLTLYDPTQSKIFSGCTHITFGTFATYSVVADQTLAKAGTYTIVITETATNPQNYALSLERIYPFPPNAQSVNLGKVYSDAITWVTGSNAFTFAGVANDEFEVLATVPTNSTNDLCMTVYFSDATNAGSGCTHVTFGAFATYTVQLNVKPTKSGPIMAFFTAAGNDTTVPTDSLEVSCLVGPNNCLPPPPPMYPPCTLKDSASYNATSSTLTMNFTVGNKSYPTATWDAWLVNQTNTTPLIGFPVSQPVTSPPGAPIMITKTASLSKEGKVGILSTLSTSAQGIVCSSFATVNTGTAP